MYSIGIDIGYTSVKLSVIDLNHRVIKNCYRLHKGSVSKHLLEMLVDIDEIYGYHNISFGAFTGQGSKKVVEKCLGMRIEEVPALVEGTLLMKDNVGSIVHIGGQSSMFITNIDTKNKSSIRMNMNTSCAAGTGSFLEEQISRMNLDLDDYTFYTQRGTHIPRIAGRCSVFAKTDITHHQQEGVRTENILLGLSYAVIRNFKSTVMKQLPVNKPIYFCGGGAFNGGLVIALKDLLHLNDDELLISKDPVNEGAMGAAVIAVKQSYSFDIEALIKYLNQEGCLEESMDVMKPLNQYSLNDSQGKHLCKTSKKSEYFLGIDVGSTSTNLVLMNDEKEIIAYEYIRTYGQPIDAITRGLKRLREKIDHDSLILGSGITGSGRYLIAPKLGVDIVRDEISSQARGAYEIDPAVDTIFEIGGQDSKYIALDNGRVVDFQMNKICAAGTGSFIEEQAKKFDIPIEEFSEYALSGTHPVHLGDRCTVFIESSIASCLSNGVELSDIAAGLCYAIVHNYLNRVVDKRKIGEKVFLQGGVAYNQGIVNAFRNVINRNIEVPPYFSMTGAYGVALLTREAMTRNRSSFIGFDQLDQMMCFKEDKAVVKDKEVDQSTSSIVFNEKHLLKNPGVPTVGIPRGLFAFGMFPMFREIFESLDFNVVLSELSSEQTVLDAQDFAMEETCFPVKLFNGHIMDLVRKDVDYILVPALYTADHKNSQARMNYGCVYMQSVHKMVQQSLNLLGVKTSILSPVIAPHLGMRTIEDSFVEMGRMIHKTPDEMKNALIKGLEAMRIFKRQMMAQAEEKLSLVKSNEMTFVVVSKMYGVLDPILNVGLAQQLNKMGYKVLLSTDLLQDDVRLDYENLYWPFGVHMIAAAKFIRKTPNMYAIFLTHHGCGPDSVLSHYFRYEMEGKPYLNIEVDEHASDVGIVTRVEAFVNSIQQNHLKKEHLLLPYMSPYSELMAHLLKDDCRHIEVLPMTSRETLKLGQSYTHVQEYISMTSLIGDIVNDAKYRSPKSVNYLVYRTEGAEVEGQYSQLIQMILKRELFKPIQIKSPFLEDILNWDEALFKRLCLCVIAGDIVNMLDLEEREKGLKEMISRGLTLSSLEEYAEVLNHTMTEGNYEKVLMIVGEPYIVWNDFLNDCVLQKLEQRRYKLIYQSLSETLWLFWHDTLGSRKDLKKSKRNLMILESMIHKIASKFKWITPFSKDLNELRVLADQTMGLHTGDFGRYRGARISDKLQGIDGILTLHSMYENTGTVMNVIQDGFNKENTLPLLNLRFDGSDNGNDMKLASFLYYLKEEQ